MCGKQFSTSLMSSCPTYYWHEPWIWVSRWPWSSDGHKIFIW